MNKYREVAVKAVNLIQSGKSNDPASAWQKAVADVFPQSTSLQDKGCPKAAFLGLCNEGMVIGLPAGEYVKPSKNGDYATAAVNILRSNRFLASQPELLWEKVAGKTKSSNSQMEVVVGLWEAKCINT